MVDCGEVSSVTILYRFFKTAVGVICCESRVCGIFTIKCGKLGLAGLLGLSVFRLIL